MSETTATREWSSGSATKLWMAIANAVKISTSRSFHQIDTTAQIPKRNGQTNAIPIQFGGNFVRGFLPDHDQRTQRPKCAAAARHQEWREYRTSPDLLCEPMSFHHDWLTGN